jgi:biopolymer transport protein ExbB
MIPLMLCSLLALMIIVYKMFDLRKSRFIDYDEVRKLRRWISADDIESAKLHCAQNNSPLAGIVGRALEACQGGESAIREAIEEAGRYQVPKIERYLGTLRTIAAVSPLLGLFGTVIGMINVFDRIKSVGLGRVAEFSGGIAEALITTATGLAIAIPALVLYNYFVDKSESIILEIEKNSSDIMRLLIEKESRKEHAVQAKA